jgi:hypothetical protein
MAALRQRPALYCARMRSLRRRLALYGLLLASCALNALIAHGQSGVRLTGTVRDGSGAYIPNALVRLFSADNVQATKTDAAGRFEFTGLSSGTYDLQALADGFLTKTVEDVQVDDQDVGPIQLIAPPGVHSGRSPLTKEREAKEYSYRTAAIQSTSMSKPPYQAGTLIKIRAGGFSGK